MKVLLVEPDYYTRYPPLGLLKLSSLHKAAGDNVEFLKGRAQARETPDKIYVTSLFTYSWKPVHATVEHYQKLYPHASVVLGGIYASLMPEHAGLSGAKVHTGLVPEAESYKPDYSLVPKWDSSVLFATRGCIRKCPFCSVPKLEGKIDGPAESITDLIERSHRKVVLWDNNVLGVPNWREIVAELRELNVEVDFNQGLDARLINEETASELAGLAIRPIRMAYDIPNEKSALERAVPALEAAGFNRRRMHVYTLYNFMDTPEDFLQRVIDLLSLGVVSYPMRYEPLNSLVKNKYVSPHWTAKQVEMVARARRVLGYGGAFPPYKALLDKFKNASSFEEAFSIKPRGNERGYREGIAGTVEQPTQGLPEERAAFRELLNDPATLLSPVECQSCGRRLDAGERGFAAEDYAGKYTGYVCPKCHPNRKWINGLWRVVLGDAFTRDGEPNPLPLSLASRTVH